MNINPIRDVFFDDAATLAMGAAFDQSCKSLRQFGRAVTVREIIAKLEAYITHHQDQASSKEEASINLRGEANVHTDKAESAARKRDKVAAIIS